MAPTIIDTHTHVVSHDRARYPIAPPADLARMPWFDEHPVDAAGLLAAMDAAGVHGAVLVQAKGAYGFDNAYAADARAVATHRLVNASIVDMADPDRLDRLTYWATERGMLGTRLFDIPSSEPSWLADQATTAVLDRCRSLGVRVALCILEPRLPLVRDLCALAPDQPVALDHCGFADLLGDTAALDSLAPVPNLRLKVTTTLLEPVLHAGRDPRDALERLCEVFGVDRLMWGSDYPQHHTAPHGAPWASRSAAATARRQPSNSEPYTEIVALGRHACSRLTPAEQARFLGGSALELWPELTPAA